LKTRKIVEQIEQLTKDAAYKLNYEEFLAYMKNEMFDDMQKLNSPSE